MSMRKTPGRGASRVMTRRRARRILELLRRHYGDPAPALAYANRYELAVAVVLSAQTTDRQVNGVTPALFARYPDFARLARADSAAVEAIIKSTGFFHNKAKNIIGLARAVVNECGSALPGTREELMRLPGIGRKSANVILSIGFGVPAFAVDTHILRIANRIGFVESDDPDAVEASVTSYLPEGDWTVAHLVFITHGRDLCDARKPRCGECPVRRLCDYYSDRST